MLTVVSKKRFLDLFNFSYGLFISQRQSIHLEIKYPLYSNVQQTQHQQQQQQPTQYINISKPIRPQGPEGVVDSMALFLKAEEMSDSNYSEAQIINKVQEIQNRGPRTAIILFLV
jgi:hypothetical protein